MFSLTQTLESIIFQGKMIFKFDFPKYIQELVPRIELLSSMGIKEMPEYSIEKEEFRERLVELIKNKYKFLDPHVAIHYSKQLEKATFRDKGYIKITVDLPHIVSQHDFFKMVINMQMILKKIYKEIIEISS